MTTPVGRVAQLWRHPVKSFQGEQLAEAVVDDDGLRGDRTWGVRSAATGRVLTGRRGDEPELHLPNGVRCEGEGPSTDHQLSAWLDDEVSLVSATSVEPASAEYFADATDDTSAAIEWTMADGRFVDAAALLLLTTGSLTVGRLHHPDGVWDLRRFRPNVFIETEAASSIEDAWCGHAVQIGDVSVRADEPCVRCTMVTRPQPDLPRDLEIYKILARHHHGTFGVWSSVLTPGTIGVGDVVALQP